MSQAEKSRVDYTNYDIVKERHLLESFLKEHSLNLSTNFLDSLKSGDVIEIYSYPEHKQLYANQEFLRLSSYTAEQMKSVPFQKLFWRESDIQQALLERAVEICKSGQPRPWGIPPHDLVESLHPKRRTFEMHMGWISPVQDSNHVVVAWASTLKVEYIFEWPENVETD